MAKIRNPERMGPKSGGHFWPPNCDQIWEKKPTKNWLLWTAEGSSTSHGIAWRKAHTGVGRLQCTQGVSKSLGSSKIGRAS